MSRNYQVPRGTQDFLPEDTALWQKVENVIRRQCRLYGYEEIRTPIFEHTEVFKTENDTSDMVTKEMYTFTDNGDRSLTLRPEGTKGVIRAFVEHKLYGNVGELPKKLYYMGPMFRYERPQKGRYRQFHQFGVEAIGARNPLLDVETIALGYSIIKELGLKNVKILVNSLGDEESRNNYRAALKEHFRPHLSELCEDCRKRWEMNPLRILDCKIDHDNPCFATAPKIRDYFNEASAAYFDTVLKGLDELEIPYEVDQHLVRGLDYYSNTVFEAVPVNAAGQQAAVFAGGQYDGLVDYFGGGPLPGVGFGMGLERIILLAKEEGALVSETKNCDVFVLGIGQVGNYALKLTQMLRAEGLVCETDFMGRGLKAQFKLTERLGSKVNVIVGEDEAAKGQAIIKSGQSKEQETVAIDQLAEKVRSILKGE